jgi:LPXTG-motif cell wall-anchored protein
MSIVNRRNAVIGWAAWTVGKRIAKRKAKAAVPSIDTETKRPNRPAMLLGLLAAAGGALLFWRRRDGGDGNGGGTLG